MSTLYQLALISVTIGPMGGIYMILSLLFAIQMRDGKCVKERERERESEVDIEKGRER